MDAQGTTSNRRRIGRTDIEVGAIGLGCWATGGPTGSLNGRTRGWGDVDDQESICAIRRGVELGITLFDTAAAYGAGHSEVVLGEALAPMRSQVVIATKFGLDIDEERRILKRSVGEVTWEYLQAACDDSLRRLSTDYIDLYQLHPGDYPVERAAEVRDMLDRLVEAGKIRYHGWSTNQPDGIRIFAQSPHCAITQNRLNVLDDDPPFLAACEELGLTWLCNGPLAMGMLTGKYDATTRLSEDEYRANSHWFQNGTPTARSLDALGQLREVLTADGRTLVQGALGWLLARSVVTLPIPGFKTIAQVEDSAAAMHAGPLSQDQMRQTVEIMRGIDDAS